MKKLLIAAILVLTVSCERSGDVLENSNYETQKFSKRTDSTAVQDSTALPDPGGSSFAPVDPKDIVPPRR